MTHLSRAEAEAFYAVHRERPFFKDLVDFMVSGPIVVQVLEGENAIAKNRDLMGATDPKKATPGTIRADFADSIDANAVHGSDGTETARVEVAYFFPVAERLLTLSDVCWKPESARVSMRARSRRTSDRSARNRFARASSCAGFISAGGRSFRAMSGSREVTADQARGTCDDRCARVCATASLPTAHASGCSMSGTATRSRPCSFPKTIAARCACRRRPAARSTAVLFDRQAGLQPQPDRPARSSASCGGPSISLRRAGARQASTEGERVISNVVLMGMGEPLQNYDDGAARACV